LEISMKKASETSEQDQESKDSNDKKAKPVPEDASSKYVKQVRRIAALIGQSSSETAKSIRGSMNGTVPMAIWKITASIGTSDENVPRYLPAIRSLSECMSLLSHAPGSATYLGASLRKMDFSEDRLERLLEEGGAALLDSLNSLAHQGRSKGLNSIDWSYPAALALADAADDAEACHLLRGKIALSYYRNAPRKR